MTKDELKRYCVAVENLRTDCGAAGTVDVYLAVRVDDRRAAEPPVSPAEAFERLREAGGEALDGVDARNPEPPASRSVQRREAAMKGEPAPTFEPKADARDVIKVWECDACMTVNYDVTSTMCRSCLRPRAALNRS